MLVIKGFYSIAKLRDNRPNMLSPIGELSNYSLTYARDVKKYSHSSFPDVDLRVFTAQQDNVDIDVPIDQQETLLNIGQWLSDRSTDGTFNGNETAFTTNFLDRWSSVLEDLRVGGMVANGFNMAFLPNWIQFKLRGIGGNYVRIWMADASFRLTFDDYHIKVLSPMDDVDLLISDTDTLRNRLSEIGQSEQLDRITALVNNQPYSRMRGMTYRWSNPSTPNETLDVTFTVIIHGVAGDNPDIIREALIQHILGLSQHNIETWVDFIPDLFRRTEFVIVPLWDNLSIPNMTLLAGLNSPTVRYKDMLPIMEYYSEYPTEHIVENLVSSTVNYKSMSYLAIGSPTNRDDIFNYQTVFSDIITMAFSDAEFSRISPRTREWLHQFIRMLQVADTLTEFNEIPLDMTRLEREGNLYVVRSFDNIQYLILSRNSYLTTIDVAKQS